MAIRIGQWILSEVELENIESVALTVDEARKLEAEYIPLRFYTSINLAQAYVHSETRKRSFILICIE